MNKIDYHFLRVGQQLLFNKVCSEMHGLPFRGLVASLRGCNMKNAPESQRVNRSKKVVGYDL